MMIWNFICGLVCERVHESHYQQRVNAKYPNSTWRVIKDIAGVKLFLKFLRKMKKDERGAPRGAALEANTG